MKRKKQPRKIHAKLVHEGVDIIDADGNMLTGISATEALQLMESLVRLLPRIIRNAKLWGE